MTRVVSLSFRYIVCKGKRSDCDSICEYLFKVNEKLQEMSGVLVDDDVTSVVPINVIGSDTAFFDYVYRSNNMLVIQMLTIFCIAFYMYCA